MAAHFVRPNNLMQKVDELLQKAPLVVVSEEYDTVNQMIVECNELLVDIENEIMVVYNYIRDNYRVKFPELESIVPNPIEYARVVEKIGNETDLTLVDLKGILGPSIIMAVCLTAPTTSGKALTDDVLQKTVEACWGAIELDSARENVLGIVENRMSYMAPNLCELVGSRVAAKLVGSAGGLGALAKMAACDVQLLGAENKKKSVAGYSSAYYYHIGYLEQTEIFQSTPSGIRKRACRVLAAKSTLLARVDSMRGDPTGTMGRAFRKDVLNKFDKWQERPPPKITQPLRVPDLGPKKKSRGGRRLRKMKERYAVTDIRKAANRMQFGVHQESYYVT
ncbi:hypothetical protein vseg_019462 [Gypsophila vaccaria]